MSFLPKIYADQLLVPHVHSQTDSTATYHDKLALDVLRPVQRVVFHAFTERMLMQIRREVAYRSRDPLVQRAAVRQMPAEAHARCADAAIAVGQREQQVN